MPKKTLHDGHIRLWDDLAKSGSDNKTTSDVWEDPDYEHLLTESILNYECFCCNGECEKCPVLWGNSLNQCLADGSPYKQWEICCNPEQRKIYAAQIRDLPWKDGGHVQP